MKLRILPLAASIVLPVSILQAEPPAVADTEAPGKTAPAEVEKPADLPPPKPLGDHVKNGLAWLAKAQNADGGWGQGGGWRVNVQAEGGNRRVEGAEVPDPSDIGNTSIALQAFLRAGTKLDTGEHSQTAAKAAAFLLTQLEADQEEGLYVSKLRDTQLQSKIGRYVDTFLAAQILADLKGSFPDAADEARRAKQLDPRGWQDPEAPAGRRSLRGQHRLGLHLVPGNLQPLPEHRLGCGAKVDLAALEKDHAQNAVGLDRQSGVVAASGAGGATGDAGIEIYRYASKVGGMTSFATNNSARRAELDEKISSPAATPREQEEARRRSRRSTGPTPTRKSCWKPWRSAREMRNLSAASATTAARNSSAT